MPNSGPDEEKDAFRASTAILVERARDGDRHAFEQLVNLHKGMIFRMVYYRTQSRPDTEDLTQEIFLQAFRSISRLKDPGLFGTWLYRIALNRVRDFHRKRRVTGFLGLSSESSDFDIKPGENTDEPSALDELLKKEFWENVESYLGKLSPPEREVFLLRFLDHLSIREIVTVLGKNESTVKTHLYRAIAKFRKEPGLAQLLSGERA